MIRYTIFIALFLYAKFGATNGVTPENPNIYPGGCVNFSLGEEKYNDNSLITSFIYSPEMQPVYTLSGPQDDIEEAKYYYSRYVKNVEIVKVQLCGIDHYLEGHYVVFVVYDGQKETIHETNPFRLCHDKYNQNCLKFLPRPSLSPLILPEEIEFDSNTGTKEIKIKLENVYFADLEIVLCSKYETCEVGQLKDDQTLEIILHSNIVTFKEEEFTLTISFENFYLAEYTIHIVSSDPDNIFILTSTLKLTEKILEVTQDGLTLSWAIDNKHNLDKFIIHTVSTDQEELKIIEFKVEDDFEISQINAFDLIDVNGLRFKEEEIDFAILYIEFFFQDPDPFIQTFHGVYDLEEIKAAKEDKLMIIIIPCAVVGAVLLIILLIVFIFRDKISKIMRNSRSRR